MKIRATVKLRNDAMISARERLGLSQREVAEKANVQVRHVCMLECLDFSEITRERAEDVCVKIAVVLGIDTDEVVSFELLDKKYKVPKMVSIKEIDTDRLLSMQSDGEIKALTNEVKTAMYEAVETLNTRYKKFIKLKMAEPNLSEEQLARRLGIHPVRIRSLAVMAREQLKKRLMNNRKSRYLNDRPKDEHEKELFNGPHYPEVMKHEHDLKEKLENEKEVLNV